MTRIIDISPTITPHLAMFPGDRGYRREITKNIELGDTYTLSSISGSVHLGAHADAPNHYVQGGQSIDERNLEYYYGPCQVLSVEAPPGERIYPKHLRANIKAERVLFDTQSFLDPETWQDNFNSLSPELIAELHEQRVVLVGIDTPSIDPANDAELQTHKAVARCDMAILEGLRLAGVKNGLYTLIALPLKLEGGDASPVRAALVVS